VTPNRKKLRVLLVLHELSHSGAPKLVLDLFDDLTDDVDVWCVSVLSGPLAGRCRKLGNLNILPRMPLGGPLAKRLGPVLTDVFVNLLRLLVTPLSIRIRRWQPDLIYLNSVWSAPVSIILPLPDVPVLMHVHELDIGIRLAVRQYPNEVLRSPNHYIAVSDAVSQALQAGHGISQNKITTILGAVPDKDVISDVNSIKSTTGNTMPFIVGGCGTSYWRKGVFLWLQVARDVVSRIGAEAVKFIWVGAADADELIMCEESARKLGVENNVQFVATTAEPLTWFRQFDVFAMTSIEDPCPIVVLENMMLGTPVLCFRNGGGTIEEVGDTGVTVDNFSVTEMADHVISLAHDSTRRHQMGLAAIDRVKLSFLVSIQSPKILVVMKGLIGTNK